MKIPKNTVSASMLRTYGSSDVRGDDHEDDRGCPRRWKAKYIDGLTEEPSYALTYGSLVHRVLELIADDRYDPTQAVIEALGPEHSLEMVDELLNDIETYLARPSSPLDDMAVLGTEIDLRHEILNDPVHGKFEYRAILDWLAVDPEDPSVIHIRDYKSNRSPASIKDLVGDVQMRGQAWLVRKLARRWTNADNPRIISHMDLVKFRDYAYEYSDDELDAWETWAQAMIRTILLDDDATPVINSYCASCPVRDSCPALQNAPAKALAIVNARPAIDLKSVEEGRRWRDNANAARLALEKVVKAWDEDFAQLVRKKGPLAVSGLVWSVEPAQGTVADVEAIYQLLGEDIVRVATVSKAAVERSSLDESLKSQVLSCFKQEYSGTRITSQKPTDAA